MTTALHNLGNAVLHQGNPRQGAAYFAEGLALSQELGDRYGIASNLVGMAGVMAAQGQPERSARLFGAAEALFNAIGEVVDPVGRVEYDRYQAIAEGLEPLPETPPAPAPPPAPQPTVGAAEYPAGLTAREVEVLRLVAQGLTDAQVAERLILSTHTVHAHLRSIYGKLEVSSRTAASQFAVNHHLI